MIGFPAGCVVGILGIGVAFGANIDVSRREVRDTSSMSHLSVSELDYVPLTLFSFVTITPIKARLHERSCSQPCSFLYVHRSQSWLSADLAA